jgi:hypothetical protein
VTMVSILSLEFSIQAEAALLNGISKWVIGTSFVRQHFVGALI